MHYFFSVTAYDHVISGGQAVKVGYYGDPSSNFSYISPLSDAQEESKYIQKEVYVVPNPATTETMAPWRLEPNNDDPASFTNDQSPMQISCQNRTTGCDAWPACTRPQGAVQ